MSPLRRLLRYPERTHEVMSNSNDDRPLDQIDDFLFSLFSFLFLFTQTPTDSLIMGQTRSTENLVRHLNPPFFSSFLLFLEVLHGNFTHLGQNSPSRTEIQIQRHRQTTRLGKAGVFFSGIPSLADPLHFMSYFFFLFSLRDSLERR